MKTTYLLPCLCGEKIPVETRQAGETVACACGRSVPVPSMMEISRLEPAPLETAAVAAWGVSQRLRLLGVVVLLIAVAGAVLLIRHRPISPDETRTPAAARRWVEGMSAARTMVEWYQLKATGLERGITKEEEVYQGQLSQYRVWWCVVVALGLGGAGLVASGRRRS